LKRVYRDVTVADGADGYAVLLDRRPARTPAGQPLRLATPALAEAVAAEWRDQRDVIRPERMPLTALAATAIDRIGPQRAAVGAALVRYAETDLVCYRADGPADLVARQCAAWDPLLAWAAERWGARLTATAGIVPIEQPGAALATLGRVIARLSVPELAALGLAVEITGSLIIGLALLTGRLDARAAFETALLDERYQAERWGADAEAEARREQMRAELAAAERFLALLAGTAVPRAGTQRAEGGYG
jgi:chaperone required for assembly of F1-ATPase